MDGKGFCLFGPRGGQRASGQLTVHIILLRNIVGRTVPVFKRGPALRGNRGRPFVTDVGAELSRNCIASAVAVGYAVPYHGATVEGKGDGVAVAVVVKVDNGCTVAIQDNARKLRVGFCCVVCKTATPDRERDAARAVRRCGLCAGSAGKGFASNIVVSRRIRLFKPVHGRVIHGSPCPFGINRNVTRGHGSAKRKLRCKGRICVPAGKCVTGSRRIYGLGNRCAIQLDLRRDVAAVGVEIQRIGVARIIYVEGGAAVCRNGAAGHHGGGGKALVVLRNRRYDVSGCGRRGFGFGRCGVIAVKRLLEVPYSIVVANRRIGNGHCLVGSYVVINESDGRLIGLITRDQRRVHRLVKAPSLGDLCNKGSARSLRGSCINVIDGDGIRLQLFILGRDHKGGCHIAKINVPAGKAVAIADGAVGRYGSFAAFHLLFRENGTVPVFKLYGVVGCRVCGACGIAAARTFTLDGKIATQFFRDCIYRLRQHEDRDQETQHFLQHLFFLSFVCSTNSVAKL